MDFDKTKVRQLQREFSEGTVDFYIDDVRFLPAGAGGDGGATVDGSTGG